MRKSMLHKRGRRIHIQHLDVEHGREGPREDPYSVTKYWVGLSNHQMICLRMGSLSGVSLSFKRQPRRGRPGGWTRIEAKHDTMIPDIYTRFTKMTGIPVDRFESLFLKRFYFEDPMGPASRYE